MNPTNVASICSLLEYNELFETYTFFTFVIHAKKRLFQYYGSWKP